MAKVVLNEGALLALTERYLVSRAEEALELYRKWPQRSDEAGYPFEDHDQLSVRDPAASRVEITPTGIKIIVESPGAYFFEFGNEPRGGGRIKPTYAPALLLPLKGGDFLGLAYVNPYTQDERPLLESVRKAFGLKGI